MPVKSGLPLAPPNIPDPAIKQKQRAVSAQQLLNATLNSDDTKWSAWVRVVRSKKYKNEYGNPIYRFETITVHPLTPPNRSHYVTIKARDPQYKGPICRADAIEISCDCSRWCFYYEFAMWYRGAAQLLYCNKDFPTVTNPALRIGGCKHILHSLRRLITASL